MKQFQNVSSVRTNGFEGELNARLETGLRGYASYSLQEASNDDLKMRLTNSPQQILKMGLSYPAFGIFRTTAELRYESSRITVFGTTTEPYFVTNLNVSTRSLMDHLESSFLVRNVFDVTYRTPGGVEHRQPGITQDGRSIILKIEYHL